MVVERERRYHHLGAYKTVHTTCSLQRRDGDWVKINAVPINGPVIKALRLSCAAAGRDWQDGEDRWSF
jgi:hypothetical protein